ncbi:MAG: MFS transporter [Candidatus Thioglobus sp.]|nr:MFS transporter [Candidatus Thioglobus sp.]
MKMKMKYGIAENRLQVALQLLQVFLVGLTIGMMRIVVPGLASAEFGLAGQQFLLLTSFVVVFGVVKAIMNLVAGRLSDIYGRRRILIAGWLIAVPIPLMILLSPSWNWIIAATFLLGINQGLCWSMTINSKLDLARSEQKGLVNGINEFAGYAAVAVAGVATAYLVEAFGARQGLFIFGLVVIIFGLASAIFWIKETLPWAKSGEINGKFTTNKTLFQLFIYASWRDKILFSLNQAGLVEKFTDAMVWIFLPVFLLAKGLSLIQISIIISAYALVWGGLQLVTGPLSDSIGRKGLIVGGMCLCGLGLLGFPYTNNVFLWALEASIMGVGMAMLYPTLGAAVADFAPATERGTLLGIYRFWRDFGYAVAALILGSVAQWSAELTAPFLLAAALMIASGLIVLIIFPQQK